MSHERAQWTITALAAAAAVLATLLVVNYLKDDSRYAFGQVSQGSAGYVVGILGPARQNKLPLFLIDNKKQTILVYEYNQERRQLFLRAARTFRYDRDLVDQDYRDMGTTMGPSVEDVRRSLEESADNNRQY